MKTNLIFIGPMGAGKTTIGKALAAKLDRPFIDSDREIEARCGVNIPTIFEFEGEAGFRQRESAVLHDILQQDTLIVATGGGAILQTQNRQLLQRRGFVIYLRISVTEQLRRTEFDKSRPLLQTADPRGTLERLAQQRNPLYSELADLTLDTGEHASQQLLLTRLSAALQSQQLIDERL